MAAFLPCTGAVSTVDDSVVADSRLMVGSSVAALAVTMESVDTVCVAHAVSKLVIDSMHVVQEPGADDAWARGSGGYISKRHRHTTQTG